MALHKEGYFMKKQEVPISNCFYETTTDIFTILTGYEVGDVEVNEDCVITRFDKQVENVVISRRVMFDDDSISITDDYVLNILPKENK